VIGSADRRRLTILKKPQSRGWTTFIEAVTADGQVLTPGIIFKGKELQSQWFTDEVKRRCGDWYYACSENGWTDNLLGLSWLEDVFMPETEPEKAEEARLIILDGHKSHTSVSLLSK